jgi:hypothetical protein
MQVYYGLENFKRLAFGVVTSGTFDGVHFWASKNIASIARNQPPIGGRNRSDYFLASPAFGIGKGGRKRPQIALNHSRENRTD